MVNEHQGIFLENGVPNPLGTRDRGHTEGKSPEREGARRGGSPRPVPPLGAVRPEVEEGVVNLPVEQFTTMIGILLAAMGGAGRGGIPASFPLGGGMGETRGTAHAEGVGERWSNGVARGTEGVEEEVLEGKTQRDPEPVRRNSSRKAREARRPGGSDPAGRARRTNVTDITDQNERTLSRAERGDKEVDSSQPPRLPRSGKRRGRSEGGPSIEGDSAVRLGGRDDTSG